MDWRLLITEREIMENFKKNSLPIINNQKPEKEATT